MNPIYSKYQHISSNLITWFYEQIVLSLWHCQNIAKYYYQITNKPENAKIYWYVDGIKDAEGEIFEISPESSRVTVTAKLVDAGGNAILDSQGNEISDTETVTVKSGFFQKLISFFKNLFGINRTVIQYLFKTVY